MLYRDLRPVAAGLALLGLLFLTPARGLTETRAPFGAVAEMTGESLRCLRGAAEDHVAVVACGDGCVPIPWQLDERDAEGRLALTEGPEPNPDDPPGLIDDDDELRWMVEDAGRRMAAAEIPAGATCALEIRVRPGSGGDRWAYAFALPVLAPRSERRYVRYDPARDVITGTRVALGFGGQTPQYLAVRREGDAREVNLLDRLKVRVSARFLGVIPVSRDESDLTTEFVAWHAGPIRVIRRQRQWVRVGFGLRSPTFGSDTYFYRDFAALPVSLRLNFPPTYFFRGIEVRAILDFRDLRGWQVQADGLGHPLTVGATTSSDAERFNHLRGEWFALVGPDATLLQVLGASPSLATVSKHLFYRELTAAAEPEAVAGEMPGVGYRLTDWARVDSGTHWFSSTSYALPPGDDPRRFMLERAHPVLVDTAELGLLNRR